MQIISRCLSFESTSLYHLLEEEDVYAGAHRLFIAKYHNGVISACLQCPTDGLIVQRVCNVTNSPPMHSVIFSILSI